MPYVHEVLHKKKRAILSLSDLKEVAKEKQMESVEEKKRADLG